MLVVAGLTSTPASPSLRALQVGVPEGVGAVGYPQEGPCSAGVPEGGGGWGILSSHGQPACGGLAAVGHRRLAGHGGDPLCCGHRLVLLVVPPVLQYRGVGLYWYQSPPRLTYNSWPSQQLRDGSDTLALTVASRFG